MTTSAPPQARSLVRAAVPKFTEGLQAVALSEAGRIS